MKFIGSSTTVIAVDSSRDVVGDATPRVAGTRRQWAPPSVASRAKEGSSRVPAVARAG